MRRKKTKRQQKSFLFFLPPSPKTTIEQKKKKKKILTFTFIAPNRQIHQTQSKKMPLSLLLLLVIFLPLLLLLLLFLPMLQTMTITIPRTPHFPTKKTYPVLSYITTINTTPPILQLLNFFQFFFNFFSQMFTFYGRNRASFVFFSMIEEPFTCQLNIFFVLYGIYCLDAFFERKSKDCY